MKIWFINQYALAPDHAGGTRHYSLGRELVRRGHQVTIIASSFDHKTRKETRLRDNEVIADQNVDGVKFRWLRTPPYRGNGLARILNMLAFAQRILRKESFQGLETPDVIIGSSPHLFGAWAAERVARKFSVPFVLEIRDLWPQSLIELGGIPEWHPLIVTLLHIERRLYRNAKKIVTLLPNAVEHIAQKGGDPDKVSWIPNGVSLEAIPDPTPPVEREQLTIVYAGTLGLANGLDVFLEAAELLQTEGLGRNFQFRFIGDGPHKASLMRKKEERRLESVFFDNPVPKTEIYKCLQDADALMLTMQNINLYRYGVSPNKLFDYLAVARPIVSGSVAINDPVAEARAGWTTPPDDARAIASAFWALGQTSLDERYQMGVRGRQYVVDHHNFEYLASKLEVVLISACK